MHSMFMLLIVTVDKIRCRTMCWSTYVIVGLRSLHCIKLILSVRVIIIILCLLIKVDRWNHAGHQLILLVLFSEHNNYYSYKGRLADTVNHQWVQFSFLFVRRKAILCKTTPNNLTIRNPWEARFLVYKCYTTES